MFERRNDCGRDWQFNAETCREQERTVRGRDPLHRGTDRLNRNADRRSCREQFAQPCVP